MPLSERPLATIVPVLMTSETYGPPYRALGTGFFIDGAGTFLTARHVFEDNPLPEGRAYAVTVVPAMVEFYAVVDLAFAPKFDMAIGRAAGAAPESFLEIADSDAPVNHDVLTVEFSGAESGLQPDGTSALVLTSSFHKGHVVSERASRFRHLEGARILELSFAALKGASGAPVIVAGGTEFGQVIGMILANLERHLLPAQIERIEGESGEPTETRHYFLPHAYAISWRHLREFVDAQRGS